MKKDRMYIDTSVIGGFFDIEFEFETKQLFKQMESGKVIFVVSDLLDLELEGAPVKVKDLLLNYPKSYFERHVLSDEARALAEQYIKEKIVGRTSIEDCYHIAMAAVHHVDVLVSWNFKHIVNLKRIKGYNAVNMKHGYHTLEIRSPKDLIYDDEEA